MSIDSCVDLEGSPSSNWLCSLTELDQLNGSNPKTKIQHPSFLLSSTTAPLQICQDVKILSVPLQCSSVLSAEIGRPIYPIKFICLDQPRHLSSELCRCCLPFKLLSKSIGWLGTKSARFRQFATPLSLRAGSESVVPYEDSESCLLEDEDSGDLTPSPVSLLPSTLLSIDYSLSSVLLLICII